MFGVLRGVGQQPLVGVLALHQQRGEWSDELMLHGQRHDPLSDLPLLHRRGSQRPAGETQLITLTMQTPVILLQENVFHTDVIKGHWCLVFGSSPSDPVFNVCATVALCKNKWHFTDYNSEHL